MRGTERGVVLLVEFPRHDGEGEVVWVYRPGTYIPTYLGPRAALEVCRIIPHVMPDGDVNCWVHIAPG